MQSTLFPSLKRPGHALTATSAVGLHPSRLFYISDRTTGLRFLVDTGAEVSVMPPSATERKYRRGNFRGGKRHGNSDLRNTLAHA